MKEVSELTADLPPDVASFAACLATILELPLDQLPRPDAKADPGAPGILTRWLGGRGLGLVPIADPASFSWPGPWIARGAAAGRRAAVVMYGVPSGVVWDPLEVADHEDWRIEDGFMVSALDVAADLSSAEAGAPGAGTVVALAVAPAGGAPTTSPGTVHAVAGRGLREDRHERGAGTFPSGVAGSALTLIEAEVCESFHPPLGPDEHRRNVITRGIRLNELVGQEFKIGDVRCYGSRLCEPCTVIDGYASRPILRALVHRGGLRADILDDGPISIGDAIEAAPSPSSSGSAAQVRPAPPLS